MKESPWRVIFSGWLSYAGARRVVPNVVRLSAAMTAASPLRTTTMVVIRSSSAGCEKRRILPGQRGQEGALLVFGVDMGSELPVEFLHVAGLARGFLDEDAGERAHVARKRTLGLLQHFRLEARTR